MKTILFILSFLGITALSTAQVIHVPAEQPTIQAGIDAAGNGDTVLVAEGTYPKISTIMAKPLPLQATTWWILTVYILKTRSLTEVIPHLRILHPWSHS